MTLSKHQNHYNVKILKGYGVSIFLKNSIDRHIESLCLKLMPRKNKSMPRKLIINFQNTYTRKLFPYHHYL